MGSWWVNDNGLWLTTVVMFMVRDMLMMIICLMIIVNDMVLMMIKDMAMMFLHHFSWCTEPRSRKWLASPASQQTVSGDPPLTWNQEQWGSHGHESIGTINDSRRWTDSSPSEANKRAISESVLIRPILLWSCNTPYDEPWWTSNKTLSNGSNQTAILRFFGGAFHLASENFSRADAALAKRNRLNCLQCIAPTKTMLAFILGPAHVWTCKQKVSTKFE